MILNSLRIFHPWYIKGILLEGKKLNINYAREQLSKLTAVMEKYFLILYIAYWVALAVINIVKCGTLKCFDYYI